MSEQRPPPGSYYGIFLARSVRLFVFGLASIITPIYVAQLGYSPLYVGLVLTCALAGTICSNLVVTWYGRRFGRKRLLFLFSVMMVATGVVLFSTTYLPLMMIGLFIGNVSVTGGEAGPFQAVETGVLPRLVPQRRIGRSFGVYNFLGYGASSLGSWAASLPSYLGGDLSVFRDLYLLFSLVGLSMIVIYSRIGDIEPRRAGGNPGGPRTSPVLSEGAKRDVSRLSALYSIDSFGGGFVSTSILSYWFYLVYGLSLSQLGDVFAALNIVTAFSTLGSPILAERLGNLRTMVYTHLISSAFVVAVPLAGSLPLALAFLFLRNSTSQMDVPTRQAFMTNIFADDERVSAMAITNSVRSVSLIFGPPLAGALLAAGLASLPILTGGLSKIGYDLLIFHAYRKRVK